MHTSTFSTKLINQLYLLNSVTGIIHSKRFPRRSLLVSKIREAMKIVDKSTEGRWFGFRVASCFQYQVFAHQNNGSCLASCLRENNVSKGEKIPRVDYIE